MEAIIVVGEGWVNTLGAEGCQGSHQGNLRNWMNKPSIELKQGQQHEFPVAETRMRKRQPFRFHYPLAVEKDIDIEPARSLEKFLAPIPAEARFYS